MTQAEGAVGEVSVIDCDSFIGEVQMFMIVVQRSNVPGSTSTLHLTGEHYSYSVSDSYWNGAMWTLGQDALLQCHGHCITGEGRGVEYPLVGIA